MDITKTRPYICTSLAGHHFFSNCGVAFQPLSTGRRTHFFGLQPSANGINSVAAHRASPQVNIAHSLSTAHYHTIPSSQQQQQQLACGTNLLISLRSKLFSCSMASSSCDNSLFILQRVNCSLCGSEREEREGGEGGMGRCPESSFNFSQTYARVANRFIPPLQQTSA